MGAIFTGVYSWLYICLCYRYSLIYDTIQFQLESKTVENQILKSVPVKLHLV